MGLGRPLQLRHRSSKRSSAAPKGLATVFPEGNASLSQSLDAEMKLIYNSGYLAMKSEGGCSSHAIGPGSASIRSDSRLQGRLESCLSSLSDGDFLTNLFILLASALFINQKLKGV